MRTAKDYNEMANAILRERVAIGKIKDLTQVAEPVEPQRNGLAMRLLNAARVKASVIRTSML